MNKISKRSLNFSVRALTELEDILTSVGEYTNSARSVAKLRSLFFEKFDFISEFPKAYKVQSDGSRYAFCQRYRIVYEYNEVENNVFILTVLHSLKKYP
ncbi:type II toxin-antitoxin system RelE/ParE family toxin [Testudinibacter aquarius]|uniref:type II toxin-antitoxin system RelE/ParE family toxin n=1 Tax=Testudinibacter TaxID=1755672 RepID=UPI00111851B0|nr:type II toxin-antitoxin system RelE/ParE family toxin [Testudinibacter aquarius]KAE9527822.1 hypothetical protein A1D24_10710 [Testudinibacter aquarius]TNH08853.1 type II toxin-antitoxin system RelE/ParE family toxin [Pasteurellaceae bacterium Phil11]TNH25899.1 type II toxin-antitoxin system RelE/ParE family toxin [Testudinibacter sp. TR-2022]TNH28478.1 type II toxin-antitoxin system RelE/ParE family toxin [Testudinibacter sp. TR-2022]